MRRDRAWHTIWGMSAGSLWRADKIRRRPRTEDMLGSVSMWGQFSPDSELAGGQFAASWLFPGTDLAEHWSRQQRAPRPVRLCQAQPSSAWFEGQSHLAVASPAFERSRGLSCAPSKKCTGSTISAHWSNLFPRSVDLGDVGQLLRDSDSFRANLASSGTISGDFGQFWFDCSHGRAD